MDRSKTRREKAIEEKLAAQIAELKGDLSDKDLMDIAQSARLCVCGLELVIIQSGCLF